MPFGRFLRLRDNEIVPPFIFEYIFDKYSAEIKRDRSLRIGNTIVLAEQEVSRFSRLHLYVSPFVGLLSDSWSDCSYNVEKITWEINWDALRLFSTPTYYSPKLLAQW
jgi:hypothetical protein